MSAHPLDIAPPPAAKQKKFLQPRFKQIGPVGDGPRIIMAAQSGMGKTTAALVLLKEYLRIVDLVWLVSGTIDVDPAYKEAKAMVTAKYKTEGIGIDDPELDPFREDLTTMKQIMASGHDDQADAGGSHERRQVFLRPPYLDRRSHGRQF